MVPSGRSNVPPLRSRSAEMIAYPCAGPAESTDSNSRSRFPLSRSRSIPRNTMPSITRRQRPVGDSRPFPVDGVRTRVTGWPYRMRPPGRVRVGLVDVQRVAVLEEAGVATADFGPDELDGDLLADVGGQAGAVLHVPAAVIRGGRHRHGLDHGPRGVQHLQDQLVRRVRGGRVDLDPV